MPEAPGEIEALRTRRNSARAALDGRIAQVRQDLAARGIGGRIADTASEEARAGLAMALDIARESKGIVAGTTALLALWLLRNPLIGWIADLLADRDAETDHDGGNEERDDD